jgi:hypothetical protein
MKYIKKFNESNGLLFEEINLDEFFKNLNLSNLVLFNEREIEFLENISEEYIEYDNCYYDDNNRILQFAGLNIDERFYIHKTDDEYYYVSLAFQDFEKFYKCDTFEGLKQLINITDEAS